MLTEYEKIKIEFNKEISGVDKLIKNILDENKNEIYFDMKKFLFTNPKRIRPLFIFIILKMLDIEIKDDHIRLACAIELLHNATLLHDDIIDNAKTRRGLQTLAYIYDEKMATLAGDYLLALSLDMASSLNNSNILHILSSNITKTILGEISQFFQKNKIITLDEYMEKSKSKTAYLFLAGVQSALLLSDYKIKSKELEDFSLRFGMVFQILNDLKSKEDIKNGIYTLPYIFMSKDDKNCDNMDLDAKYLQKSQELLDMIVSDMFKILNFCNNEYKDKLIRLIEILRKEKC